MKRGTVLLMLALLVSSVSAGMLRDDFNELDLENWVIVEWHETASIENGELIAGVPPPDAHSTTLILLPFDGMPASDYDVAVSVRLDHFMFQPMIANGVGIGLRGHSADRSLGLADNDNLEDPLSLAELSYYFFIGQNTDGQWGVGASIWHITRVVKDEEGHVRVVDTGNKTLRFSPFDVKLDEWYRLRVIADGDLFRVFVNEEQMLGLRDARYPEGAIYLSSGEGNLVRFDDFEIKYDGPAAVQPRRKLATTWSEIKRKTQ